MCHAVYNMFYSYVPSYLKYDTSSPKNQNSIVLLCWNHAMVDPSKSMELDLNYKVFDYIDKLFTNYSSISSIKYWFCIKIARLP